jgi:hypothetical protein
MSEAGTRHPVVIPVIRMRLTDEGGRWRVKDERWGGSLLVRIPMTPRLRVRASDRRESEPGLGCDSGRKIRVT